MLWYTDDSDYLLRCFLNVMLCVLQDVVEIMKESLYDKYVDEHGHVDFGRSGGMSQQKEAKRFLSALHKQSELQQKDCFSISVSCLSVPIHSNFLNQNYDPILGLLFSDIRRYTVWLIKLAFEFPILIL